MSQNTLTVSRVPSGSDHTSIFKYVTEELKLQPTNVVFKDSGVVLTFFSTQDCEEAKEKLSEAQLESGPKEEESDEKDEVRSKLEFRRGFTSEDFKVELQNLPRHFNLGQVKKLVIDVLKLKVHRFKPAGLGKSYMFINFANEEDRDIAIDKLNGCRFRGNRLRAFKARAAVDPMLKQRLKDEDDSRTPEEKIMQATCPLAHLTYDEQIAEKSAKVVEVMDLLRKRFMTENRYLTHFGLTEDNFAVVTDMVRSPIINGYRNKCEFTVGTAEGLSTTKVGFRFGAYRHGSVAVMNIDNIPIVSDVMKGVVAKFEAYLLGPNNNYESFDAVSQSGYWKQLTLRESQSKGDVLAVAMIHPQSMSPTEQDNIRSSITSYFKEHVPEVTTLQLQFAGNRVRGDGGPPPADELYGPPFIRESVMGLDFEISATSFFQTNTLGAARLFEAIESAADLDDQTTLFDVCCGTGTIGLCLASKVARVIGVELIKEAVDNARRNAEVNGIENAEFYAGRAENVLPDLLKTHSLMCPDGKTVAVVDPPRAGLTIRVITALRASNVQKLVYVSCDAKAALDNFVALGRQPSKMYMGEPFVPKKVIPLDLFPHTAHNEVVVVFERIAIGSNEDNESMTLSDV